MKWKTIWDKIIHILAGIALGYILFGCKSSKSGCDAYSQNKTQHENISRK
jgi:hypothetical protein